MSVDNPNVNMTGKGTAINKPNELLINTVIGDDKKQNEFNSLFHEDLQCKICQCRVHFLFEEKILNKYNIKYYQCGECDFIQTEKEFWLQEAYNNAITHTDVGYVARNIMYSEIVSSFIRICFSSGKRYIDYGGGYGLFVRLMRDNGFDFYRQDIYCENIFAKYFDVCNLKNANSFELVTAFEVFEHLQDPIKELDTMFSYSPSILFSTELQPATVNDLKEWWYIVPHTGQHIALYSINTLKKIAEKYHCNLYSNNRDLHLLTPKKFAVNPVYLISKFYSIINKILSRRFQNPRNLILKDYKAIMKCINSSVE